MPKNPYRRRAIKTVFDRLAVIKNGPQDPDGMKLLLSCSDADGYTRALISQLATTIVVGRLNVIGFQDMYLSILQRELILYFRAETDDDAARHLDAVVGEVERMQTALSDVAAGRRLANE
eukprot:CAMPEP_0174856336 /NCGR_PEP_ID=MMETSP1114-20130205/35692_1 /TAXON_ID=312471 /ORGANISM="Neobodo designis, Strain CCAP 1951/1" /LENGTH=119 /DNA_ID=CAMNT_0016091131 /DNA_START=15 /DNA_END=374 /DNA_ORIENTATION=-